MSKRARKMTCEEFQRLIPELVNSDADPSDHPHAKACAECRQIAQELEVIAVAARKLFPEQPAEWSEIPWWPR